MTDKGKVVGQGPDEVIICATNRLVRVQMEVRAREKRKQGYVAWETPAAYSWEDWLYAQCRKSLADSRGVLLTRDQAAALWALIIRRNNREDLALLNLPQAARAAWLSWTFAGEWQIDERAMAKTGDQDTRVFLEWCHVYREKLSNNKWIDPVTAATALDWHDTGIPAPPSRVIWRGFDSLSLLQKSVIERLRRAGSEVVIESASTNVQLSDRTHMKGLAFASTEVELATALLHARHRVEEESGLRIAIIVPELERQLIPVEHLAKNLFYPDLSPLAFAEESKPYHISLGRSLSEQPMINAALLALQILRDQVNIEDARSWMVSPWMGGAGSEMQWRIGCEEQLRRNKGQHVSLGYLRKFVMGFDDGRPEILLEHLEKMTVVRAGLPGRATPRSWVRVFDHWLEACGWPGDTELKGHEFQLLQAWQDILMRVTGLNLVHGEVGIGEALGMLSGIATNKRFRSRSEGAPVEIMGMLESAGQQFDEIWITGMSDVAWPPGPDPEPFIPVVLQREAGAPNSSPEFSLARAQRMTSSLVAAAPIVTVSYPVVEEERKFDPSPIFTGLDFIQQEADQSGLYTVSPTRQLEVLVDELARPAVDDVPARGGSQLITNQSQCPFRAFAIHRLGAEVVDAAEPGLDPAERGQLVHNLMEDFWSGVTGRDELNAISPEKQDARIGESVDRVIGKVASHVTGFTRELLKLERPRLANLLREWVEVDLARDAGFMIEELELSTTTEFAGLSIKLRIDRVDRLEDGALLVIDYKTGRVSTAAWAGERPEEPQLPFYVMALGEEDRARVAGLAFAQVRTGECKYSGVADKKAYAKGIGTPAPGVFSGVERWDDLVKHWSDVLGVLEQEFVDGVARVDPTKKACTYCDLHSLCRINEIRSVAV